MSISIEAWRIASAIRAALGDSADGTRYVQTLPKRGFRSRPVVAVSIFDNETGDPGYDRPVHALADTVVDRLTALGVERVGVVGNAAILRIPRHDRDLERMDDDASLIPGS